MSDNLATTPGPWKFYQDTLEIRAPRPLGEPPCADQTCDGNCMDIAQLLRNGDEPTTIADGRLMAAAPDLLEALKFMTAHRESQLIQAGVTRKAEDIERAKAAIEKARAE